jgi:hypothetical protein
MDTIYNVPKGNKNYNEIKKIIITPGKHLKDEKKRRQKLCELRFDEDHIYDPSENVYKKYNTSFQYYSKRPFQFKDCIKNDAKAVPDKDQRLYKEVYNKHQCDKVKGIWSDKSLNRDNIIDEGVCWIRPSDAECANKYQNKNLLDYGKTKNTNLLYTEESNYQKRCNENPACEWNNDKKDCYSQESIEYTSEMIIPQLPKDWPGDITKFDIQKYLVQYYSKMLDAYPQRYMPIIGTGNRCTSATGFKISQPQTVINMIMKGMAKSVTNRGLLVWHGTGSGKTCTAAAVMEAYWDTNKNIVFASSVEAIASNPPDTFIECCVRLMPRFKDNRDKSFKEQMDIARVMFEKRGIKFMTFAQLCHYAFIANPLKVPKEKEEYHKNFLNNTILIIDEVQNIFKPLPTQRKEHDALRKFLTDYNNKYTRNLQMVILSATPGESPEEVIDLLNMIRDKNAPLMKKPDFSDPVQVNSFAKSVRGLVSFFEISSDLTKFPKVIKSDPYVLPMSMQQYRKYVEAFKDLAPENKDFEKLQKEDKTEKYYRGPRKYANMLYDFETNMTLYEFSSKIPALLENIKKYPDEKHYIYSVYHENLGFGGQGARAIAKILEKELGYQRMDFKEARSLNNADKLPDKRKRYALAITNELSSKGNTIGENLKELTKLYNRAENKNGDYIHVFIASQGFSTGTDYKGIRHVHIFEPTLSPNKETQIIGRSSRYCSHSHLDYPQQWTSTIHRYLSDFPIEIKKWNIDEMKKILNNFQEELVEKEKQLAAIKGKKGVAELRENLKKDISGIKEHISEHKKELKEYEFLDPSKVEMIDLKITEESKAKIRDLMLLNTILKQTSIDCILFKEFHAQSGQQYKCWET